MTQNLGTQEHAQATSHVAGAPILLCYDRSPDAERAIDMAATLFPGRRAVVVDVAPALTFAEGISATTSSIPGGAYEDLNEAEARRGAEAGATYARDAGFEASPRGAVGTPTWEAIVDIADEIDAAVIVVGSRGLSGIRELAKGSVSHDVAVHAGRPVMIVPPPRAD
jgi:nucleotide-binding universal stress UspA family protein